MAKHLEPIITSPYISLHKHIKSYPVTDTDYLIPGNAKEALAGEFFAEKVAGELTRPNPSTEDGDFEKTYYLHAADATAAPSIVEGLPQCAYPLFMLWKDPTLSSTDVKYRQQIPVFIGPTPVRVKVGVYEHDGNIPYAPGMELTVGALTDADGEGATGRIGLRPYAGDGGADIGGGLIYGKVVSAVDAQGYLEVELWNPVPGPGLLVG